MLDNFFSPPTLSNLHVSLYRRAQLKDKIELKSFYVPFFNRSRNHACSF